MVSVSSVCFTFTFTVCGAGTRLAGTKAETDDLY
jgi:hypothetical protein